MGENFASKDMAEAEVKRLAKLKIVAWIDHNPRNEIWHYEVVRKEKE